MKNAMYSIKMMILSVMTIGGVARNCVKTTTRAADVYSPVFKQTQNFSKGYSANDEIIMKVLKVANHAKDARNLSQLNQPHTKNDTVVINLPTLVVKGK